MNNHEKIKLAFGGVKAPADLADRIIRHTGAEARPLRPRRYDPRRFASIAAALMAALCLAGTAAYAAVNRTFNPVYKADVGLKTEIVASGTNGFTHLDGTPMNNDEDDWAMEDDFLAGTLLYFDAETAALINETLAGVLFNENGEPAGVRLKPSPRADNGWVLAYGTPNHVLYDQNGERIIGLRWNDAEQRLEYKYPYKQPDFESFKDYDKAAALLGIKFMLPDMPGFSRQDFAYTFMINPDLDNRASVYVNAKNKNEQVIFFFTEKAGADGEAAYQWHVSGVMEETEINGVTIYLQRDADGTWGRYLWQDDGAAYCLFYSDQYNFDDEDYFRIIESMLP